MTVIRHRIKRILVSSLFAFLAVGVCGAEDLPNWGIGSWWEYTTNVDVHADQADGGYVDLSMTDENTRYTLNSIESRQLTHGSMPVFQVYILSFNGILNAEGTAHIVDPFPADIPIEIRDATVHGSWWVDTETLAGVYFYRKITGPLFAYILGTWSEVGSVDLDIYEEYIPPKDEMDFPLETGDSWVLDTTLYTYGHYYLEYDIGGSEVVEDDFDESQAFSIAMDVTGTGFSHGIWTYFIEGDEMNSDGIVTVNYGPEPKNIVYERFYGMPGGGGFQLEDFERILGDFVVQSAPTPTPEHTVTPTPIPPTATPTTAPGEPTNTPHPPTSTPSITPTPTPADPQGIYLALNKSMFDPGDTFLCSVTISNPGPAVVVQEYVVLDVYSNYWFWPGWTQEPDYMVRELEAGAYYPGEEIITFTWPEGDSAATGLKFWAAMLNAADGELEGEFSMVEWGYNASR